MKNSTIEVAERSSCKTAGFAYLNMIVGAIAGGKCNVLVGSPGLPIVIQEMRRGDAILYDTIGDGVLEVRLTSIHDGSLGFKVTRVSQRLERSFPLTA